MRVTKDMIDSHIWYIEKYTDYKVQKAGYYLSSTKKPTYQIMLALKFSEQLPSVFVPDFFH